MSLMRRVRGGQAGVATVEATVLMPGVMLFTLLAITLALLYNGHTVVTAAAQDAAAAVAQGGGTSETARADALNFLAEVANGDLEDVDVTVEVTDQAVTVQVKATTTSLVGIRPRVTGTARIPVERLTW